MIRFRAPGTPLLWLNSPEDLQLEKEGETLHLKNKSTSIGNALFHLPFFLVGLSIFVGTIILGTYWAYLGATTDSVCDHYEDEVELRSGEIYCESNDSWGMSTSIKSVEVAEQHFKYTIAYDQDEPVIEEFRWSENNGILAIGLVGYYEEEDLTYYSCNLYKKESSLSENWTFQELVVSDYWYSMPSWCREDTASTENVNYAPAEGPLFDGEDLYFVFDANYGDINIETYTITSLDHRHMHVPYSGDAIGPIIASIFGLFFGFVFLNAGDGRKMNLQLNPSAQTISVRKTFGGTRLSGWTWKNIDFNSLKMVRYEKTAHHQSGGGEDGPIRRWKTYHKGIEVSFFDGKKPVDVLFLEHGNNFQLFDSTLQNICDSLGVKVPEIQERIRPSMPSKDNYSSVKLQDFDVSSWDSKNDAMLLVGWHNNISSRDTDLTVEEVMDAAEIQTFDSKQDAQKFLDYLVSLLDEEMGDSMDEKASLETSSNEVDGGEENIGEQDGAPQSETIGAFWNDA